MVTRPRISYQVVSVDLEKLNNDVVFCAIGSLYVDMYGHVTEVENVAYDFFHEVRSGDFVELEVEAVVPDQPRLFS
jgi:hypothetical protein